ncbi:MAG: hypothetical protein PS018_17305 [bacterium]|nr:hypothetical protein [bacterium]
MTSDFNGASEPMRAIRDLISACEAVFGPDAEEQGILARAQAGFTTLRGLHGDTRPAEDIGQADLREPDFATLQMTAGALRCVARMLPEGERHVIVFTGAFAHLSTPTISDILDMANDALGALSPVADADTAPGYCTDAPLTQ